ncbi:anthrax toxin lethal factor-related metalloendopeptidase [Clostridium perfringens]
MKKNKIIAIGVGILVVGVGVGIFIFSPKEKIELFLDDNKLTWIDNSNSDMLDCRYEIYNDDFSVAKLTDKSYFVTKEKLIDEIGPMAVERVYIDYSGDKIKFKWDDVLDKGTDNHLWVGLYNNKGRQLSYSNSVTMNFSSGIYRYIVEHDGVKYEAINNEFEVDRTKIPKGVTKVRLYAIDKRSNIGEIVEVPLYNYDVSVKDDGEYIYYGVDDNTQSYSYKYYIDGKDKGTLSSNAELNDLFKDDDSPNTVNKVTFNNEENDVLIMWDDVKDKTTKNKLKIEGFGEKYKNTVSSEEIVVERTSGIKGYYYAVNKDKNYKISEVDNFIEVNGFKTKLEYGDYYFHITAVDKAGNLSNQKTIKFSIEEPPKIEEVPDKPIKPDKPENKPPNVDIKPEQNKPPVENPPIEKPNEDKPPTDASDKVDNMIVNEDNVEGNYISDIKNNLSKLSSTMLDRLYNSKFKIYVTNGAAEDVYKKLTGKSISNIDSIFVKTKNGPVVIVESAYIDNNLMLEVVRGLDYTFGSGVNISSSSKFIDLYEEERKSLFGEEDSEINSSKEYFEKVMLMYIDKDNDLIMKAPKTYDFIKNTFK